MKQKDKIVYLFSITVYMATALEQGKQSAEVVLQIRECNFNWLIIRYKVRIKRGSLGYKYSSGYSRTGTP